MAEASDLHASIARLRAQPPLDELNDVFVVLATLGAHLMPLDVVNFHDLTAAQEAVIACLVTECLPVAGRFKDLDDAALQGAITCAFVFCAECHPMPIYYGFGAAVLQNWAWAERCFTSSTCAAVDKALAALKDSRKSFWLLKKVPAGMDRFTPHPTKIRQAERKLHEKAREDLAKRLEKRGFPPAKDKSFAVNSWWIPFATWNSPFTLTNVGHNWHELVRWQMDPGRLLHAFVVSHEVNMRTGELMLVPAGPGECLVRWLEGLAGLPFKLVSETDLDLKKLGLSTATKNTLHFLDDRRDAYVIKDPSPTETHPIPLPSASSWASANLGTPLVSLTTAPELDAVESIARPTATELPGSTEFQTGIPSPPIGPDQGLYPVVSANEAETPAELPGSGAATALPIITRKSFPSSNSEKPVELPGADIGTAPIETRRSFPSSDSKKPVELPGSGTETLPVVTRKSVPKSDSTPPPPYSKVASQVNLKLAGAQQDLTASLNKLADTKAWKMLSGKAKLDLTFDADENKTSSKK